MKVLILGASGFFGRNIVEALAPGHDVFAADRAGDSKYRVDLMQKDQIARVLSDVQPEVVINCAGVVDNSEKANLNPILTENLLEQILLSGLKLRSIIISGSAAEYGVVDAKDIPVKESAPLNASSIYGLSKLKETTIALDYRTRHQLPVVIARIFNPIGVGMGPRFLTTRVLQQIQEIRDGARDTIEVSRLDSKRDLLNIKDAALAVKVLAESNPKELVYNIGSGMSTSNGELIELILRYSNLTSHPKVVETAPYPEDLVAIQADITRIQAEFGWKPTHPIDETVKEIVHATGK